jgi:predicted transcriptional regulator of viral defense system
LQQREDSLTREDIILALLRENKGYLTTKMAREHAILGYTLHRMVKQGLLERVAPGLYTDMDTIPDPFFIAQHRCPKGIFSHETALFFHGLSDRVPLRLMMTIPTGWNSQLLTDRDMVFFYCKPELAGLGVGDSTTPLGLPIRVYDVERTLCDCLRAIEKLDRDLVLTALKRYAKDPAGDKSKLLEYAEIFKIRDMVRRYMEVLS